MSGHPPAGQYDDGYAQPAAGQDGYYHDEQQGYYDQGHTGAYGANGDSYYEQEGYYDQEGQGQYAAQDGYYDQANGGGAYQDEYYNDQYYDQGGQAGYALVSLSGHPFLDSFHANNATVRGPGVLAAPKKIPRRSVILP